MISPIAPNVCLGIDFRGKELTLMAPAVVTVCFSGMITQPEIAMVRIGPIRKFKAERTIPGFYLLNINDS